MKTLVVFNATSLKSYAFEKIFDNNNAIEKSFLWARACPNVKKILYLSSSGTHSQLLNEKLEKKIEEEQDFNLDYICKDSWTVQDLYSVIKDNCQDFTNIIYAFADCPFYNIELTKEILELHNKYLAEYSFADGYPIGIVPEVLCADLPGILLGFCQEKNILQKKLNQNSIFDTLKLDINSFDIETLISDFDYRYLRYNFACNSKHNFILCKKAYELNKDNVLDICHNSAECLKIIPAYYSVQITSKQRQNCIYQPTLQEITSKNEMSIEEFNNLIDKIEKYSEEAVINISYFCEATEHSNLIDLIKIITNKPGLSVLIETTGKNLSENLVKEIAQIVNNAPKPTNGYERMYWIVHLDAVTEQMYAKVNGNDFSLAQATQSYELLKKYFEKTSYPQFVRMDINDEELESFFRYWKAQGQNNQDGNLIIQKYDHYCGFLPSRKVADLSPVIRYPCWQLRREMYILIDGSVPRCKECLNNNILGNVFNENLEEIFNKSLINIKQQLNNQFLDICKDCDEYYTFNF